MGMSTSYLYSLTHLMSKSYGAPCDIEFQCMILDHILPPKLNGFFYYIICFVNCNPLCTLMAFTFKSKQRIMESHMRNPFIYKFILIIYYVLDPYNVKFKKAYQLETLGHVQIVL